MKGVDDPFAVLGVTPDVSPEELTAAYRRLAKEWHPDRALGPDAGAHMARINAAYDAARAILADPRRGRDAPADEAPGPGPAPGPARRARVAAWWLDPEMRSALGGELARALHDEEDVVLVAPTSTWASPQARLAVTDRRLLWLNEDAVGQRVRSLRFEAIAEVGQRPSWPRGRTSTVRLRDHAGRRFSFAELRPDTADAVVRHLRERAAA